MGGGIGGKLKSKVSGQVPTKEPSMTDLAKSDQINGLNDEKVDPNKFQDQLTSGVTNRPAGKTGYYSYNNMQQIEAFAPADFNPPARYGAASLFNPYSLFVHPTGDRQNQIDFLYDKSESDGAFPKKDRTVTLDKLLKEFDPDDKTGRGFTQPYYALDFLYSKYYGKIPLNHLITLRRFPYPTFDNLEFGQQENHKFRPLAQAVTFFGEPTGNSLEELLRFKGSIKWKELEADINDVDGNEQGFGDSPAAATGGKTSKALGIINYAAGNTGDLSQRRQAEINAAKKYGDVDYTNKTLGPVNVITKTHIRDRGIGETKEYSLIFEFQLKSYNQVNPKLAMLDLLGNMLALCFNNAKFWGGANRYFPNSPQFSFFGDQDAYYKGDYGTYGKSVLDTLKGGLGNIADQFNNIIGGILKGDLSALKNLASKGVGMVLDAQSAKTRPAMLGFKSLLSGLPVGEWHMVVGNPLNPIAMIGNLICTGFEFEFSNFLGNDDFPNELKFTINLKDGRPRDKGDIESIFNRGQGRLYYPPKGLLDVGNNSSATGAESPSSKKSGPTRNNDAKDKQQRGFGSIF